MCIVRNPHPHAVWEVTDHMQARVTAAGLMLVAPYASHWRSITLQRRHHAQPATYPPHGYGMYDYSGAHAPLTEQTRTQVSCLVKRTAHWIVMVASWRWASCGSCCSCMLGLRKGVDPKQLGHRACQHTSVHSTSLHWGVGAEKPWPLLLAQQQSLHMHALNWRAPDQTDHQKVFDANMVLEQSTSSLSQ